MNGHDSRPIATLRHVSASGRLDSFWEYDPARRLLMGQVAIPGGEPAVFPDDLDVEGGVRLTTDRDGRRDVGSWIVTRRGAGDVFVVMPARFRRDGTIETVAVLRRLATGPIVLLSAPPAIETEMLALFEPDPLRTLR